ncbi:DNA replication licensing factor mcm10 [Plectosphaerella cucumerina]|uniref:DNA replication licensing factor mcm10 n=1 Tax=Plectosphaerella cucumerina TaxID=40658 RepID=A0A8K0X9G1_9PEZI|nr:DNA replication licensing factor mcm10 [Plectosphaerella cucumerina]
MAPPPRQVDEIPWPPRSPRDVLLSTPGGRERLRQMATRTTPSPSPLKKSTLPPKAFDDAVDGDDEDEDEETLQLKLQEIQARLRLKKLQKTKKDGEASAPAPAQKRPVPPPSQTRGPVVIPASPVRKSRPEPPPQTSPRRVLLGIDKGLSARDVSLKRAPSLRKDPYPKAPGAAAQNGGGFLQTSRTPHPTGAEISSPARPLTFNERLAVARDEEKERKEKKDRIQQARTQSFGITKAQMEEFKSKAVTVEEQPEADEQFSRADILGTQAAAAKEAAPGKSRAKRAPEDVPEAEASAFEPYSSLHLKKRNVPHSVLTRHFTGKKILTMKEMLRDVKAPDFELPECEQDIVFFAIVGRRSEPRMHNAKGDKKGKDDERGKYMVLTLVDLQFELELFLFGTGFDRYWKIAEGTVLAILNPTIMPPPRGREATGRFSIVVNSDADRVIEIGVARDLGFCISVKKDGTPCHSWVNAKRTQFCEYHTNEAVERARKGRIEMSATDRLGLGRRKVNSHDIRWGKDKEDKNRNYDRETQTRWFASKSMSSAELIDGGTAFVDQREKAENLKRRLLAEERERAIMERLGSAGSGAGAAYLRQMAKGSRGVPVIVDGSGTSGTGHDGTEPQLDEAARSLLAPRPKDHQVHLGPVKRKRAESALSSATTTSTTAKPSGTAFGWGGGLKDKLTRMKGGEKFQLEVENAPPQLQQTATASSSAASSLSADPRPVRKKTRFVTEKGIREAGRESLGDTLPEIPASTRRRMVVLDDEDDDDELVILR